MGGAPEQVPPRAEVPANEQPAAAPQPAQRTCLLVDDSRMIRII
jgi:hypothetical protein